MNTHDAQGYFELIVTVAAGIASAAKLVEGYVCPKCAAKRLVGSGRRTLLVSLIFSVLMLISAWIVMDPLKVYVQKIYIPVVIVLFAAAAVFLVLGFYMMQKQKELQLWTPESSSKTMSNCLRRLNVSQHPSF